MCYYLNVQFQGQRVKALSVCARQYSIKRNVQINMNVAVLDYKQWNSVALVKSSGSGPENRD